MYDSESKAVVMGSERKLRARIDLSSAKIVGDVELGEEVTIKVTGKVTEMRAPSKYMGMEYTGKSEKKVPRTDPGSLEIEVSKLQVEVDGEWSDPGEDD